MVSLLYFGQCSERALPSNRQGRMVTRDKEGGWVERETDRQREKLRKRERQTDRQTDRGRN